MSKSIPRWIHSTRSCTALGRCRKTLTTWRASKQCVNGTTSAAAQHIPIQAIRNTLTNWKELYDSRRATPHRMGAQR